MSVFAVDTTNNIKKMAKTGGSFLHDGINTMDDG